MMMVVLNTFAALGVGVDRSLKTSKKCCVHEPGTRHLYRYIYICIYGDSLYSVPPYWGRLRWAYLYKGHTIGWYTILAQAILASSHISEACKVRFI